MDCWRGKRPIAQSGRDWVRIGPDAPAIGEQLEKKQPEKDQAVQLGDVNGAGAVAALLRVIANADASVRQRVRAASTVLAYKTEDDGAVELAKQYLQLVASSADAAIDHKIEAAEQLRKCESRRILPEIVRPNYIDNAEPAEPSPIPIPELLRQRREYSDRMQAKMAEQLREERVKYGWET